MSFKRFLEEIAVRAQQPYTPKVGHRVRTIRGIDINGVIEKISGGKATFRATDNRIFRAHLGNLMRHETEPASVEESMNGSGLSSKLLRSYREKAMVSAKEIRKEAETAKPISKLGQKLVKRLKHADDALTVLQMREDCHPAVKRVHDRLHIGFAEGDWVIPTVGRKKNTPMQITDIVGDQLILRHIITKENVPTAAVECLLAYKHEVAACPPDKHPYGGEIDFGEIDIFTKTDITHVLGKVHSWDIASGSFVPDRPDPAVQAKYPLKGYKRLTENEDLKTVQDAIRQSDKKAHLRKALFHYAQGKHLGKKEAGKTAAKHFATYDKLKQKD
jgi:hypothetical protein